MDVPSIASLATELSNVNVSNNYQVKVIKGANEQLEAVATKLLQGLDPDKGNLIDVEA